MNEFVIKLAKAMPALGRELSTIDWGQYSTQYAGKSFDTLILEYRPAGKITGTRFSWGDIRGSWDSLEVLRAKFTILDRNPTFRSSLEGRKPENRLYGGAIRLNNGTLLGATRKPELGDHVIVVAIARYMGLIDQEDWLYLANTFHPSVLQALVDKDMPYEKYSDMLTAIVWRVKKAIPGAM